MFSRAYKGYVLVAMAAVHMLQLVDRGLMVLLLQPIKEDLQLSDTQLGFVTGIAFGLFYATLGLPIARWADRGNRVTITSIAIGLWGVTVIACVFVTNFIQLVFARIAAAVGESGCMPPTYSLIGDYFPEPSERTRAMTIYVAGGLLSSLVTFIAGGWLNELYGWRTTFFILGLPGLVLAVIVKLTLIEPRSFIGRHPAGEQASLAMPAVLRVLWNCTSLRNLSIGVIVLYTMGLGLGPWYAAFMMRSHGMGTRELGVWLGGIFALGGAGGALLGGYVASRWFANNERSQMRVTAVAVALLVPCFLAFLMLPQKHQALIALIPLMVVFSFFLAPTFALMQRLVVDDMRATMWALVMLLANLIGMGIGPQVVGVLSDLLLPMAGVDSLRYAMLIMSVVSLWASYHFWKVGLTVKEDLLMVANRVMPEAKSSSQRRVLLDSMPAK